MITVGSFEEARQARRGTTGLVPTMGFLHEGHLSLVDRARAECATVVVSLFVNPLQFDEPGDLDRYPHDLERDQRLAEAHGADCLFAPTGETMYPDPPQTRVAVPPLETEMEGLHRPGHFPGVATVVAKLLAGLQPDRAYFGRKDAQQLTVVRRMSLDLSFPVEIVGGPTVRERDGLALSSRNVFLSDEERHRALSLSGGLMRAADAFDSGETDARALEGVVRDAATEVEVDYVILADAGTARQIPTVDRQSFLAVAARVGSTRLIDNIWFDVPAGGVMSVDRGIRLTEPSILYGGRHAADY